MKVVFFIHIVTFLAVFFDFFRVLTGAEGITEDETAVAVSFVLPTLSLGGLSFFATLNWLKDRFDLLLNPFSLFLLVTLDPISALLSMSRYKWISFFPSNRSFNEGLKTR